MPRAGSLLNHEIDMDYLFVFEIVKRYSPPEISRIEWIIKTPDLGSQGIDAGKIFFDKKFRFGGNSKKYCCCFHSGI